MQTNHEVAEPATPDRPLMRPYLSIVEGLKLDSVRLAAKPGKPGKRSPASTPTPAQVSAANDGTIFESGRNNALTSLAGAMRRKGMTHEAIEAALQAENMQRCNPPLDPDEVRAVAASIMRYPAASADEVIRSLTDTGNATRFGSRCKDRVKYVVGLGWHIWDGLRWRRDEIDEIVELAKQVSRDIYNEGAALDAQGRDVVVKHAKASLQAPRLRAMLELARSLPELVTKIELLDTHDMLLGVANGVVNLRTGKLQPARREDLLTRHSRVAFDAAAKCPLFEAFIGDVTGGDKALARYLQRVVGHSLTGSPNEQCFFFLYGSGRNGKSTFLNVLVELVGAELARRVQPETLMARRAGGSSSDIARLHTVRVVVANEIEQGAQLAESLVKQMTGSEAVSARFLYRETFEFLPKFKLFIAGNHKPLIQGRDDGIWRRLRLVPFVVSIPPSKCDKDLLAKLIAELPGILNWAIKGCVAWQKAGVAAPKVVTDAVDSYREEMDIIGQWVAECGSVDPSYECKAGDAYLFYKLWSERNGYKPMAAGNFGRDFALRFPKVKRKDGNYYLGVKVA